MTTSLVIAALVTTIVFLGLDFIWLKTTIGPFFENRIGHMMRDDPKIGVAAGFYVIYALGAVYFAVYPALQTGNISLALFNGALLGLIGYGTYEATSMAIMKDWTYGMVALDITWGMFVTAISSAAGYWAAVTFG